MAGTKFVPLSELEAHTDALDVDDLGLSATHDLDTVGLNISAIEGARRWGGLGRIAFTTDSTTPISTGYFYQTLHERLIAGPLPEHLPALHEAEVNFVEPTLIKWLEPRRDYEKPESTVTVFGQAVAASVKNDLLRHPAFDRAESTLHYTNLALQLGVKEAALRKLVDGRTTAWERLKSFGVWLAMNPGMIEGHQFTSKAAAVPIAANGLDAAYEMLIHGRGPRQRQWSAFFGALPYDRIAMVRAHAGRTLLKELR